MWPDPNFAFVLICLGVLAIYYELIWPGKIAPGVLGLAAILSGSFLLGRFHLDRLGALSAAASCLLFWFELYSPVGFIAGTAGAALLVVASLKILPGPHGISLAIALPSTLLLGSLTTFLAYSAKRARLGKRRA